MASEVSRISVSTNTTNYQLNKTGENEQYGRNSSTQLLCFNTRLNINNKKGQLIN